VFSVGQCGTEKVQLWHLGVVMDDGGKSIAGGNAAFIYVEATLK